MLTTTTTTTKASLLTLLLMLPMISLASRSNHMSGEEQRSLQASLPCSVCKSGGEITKPDQYLGLTEPIRLDDCRALNSIAPLLPLDSVDCAGIQSMGGLCGCPIPEHGCRLCGNTGTLMNPSTVLRPVPDTVPDGLEYNCAFYESSLHVLLDNETECLEQQSNEIILEKCGCSNYKPQEGGNGDGSDEQAAQPACRLCPFGLSANASLAVEGIIDGIGMTCSELSSAVQEFPLDSNECNEAQRLSTLCGCPVPKESCTLCPHELVDPQQAIVLNNDEGGEETIVTCEYLQAWLHYNVTADSAQCAMIRQEQTLELSDGSSAMDGSVALLQQDNTTTKSAQCLCQPPPVLCNICPNGEFPVPYPDKPVDTFMLGLPEAMDSCQQLADAASQFAPHQDECKQLQVLGQYCGCSPAIGGCNLCGNNNLDNHDAGMTRPEEIYQWTRGHVLESMPGFLKDVATDNPTSCSVFGSTQNYLYPDDSIQCFVLSLKSDACGCPSRNIKVYTIVQRVCAGLSIMMALLVILDILRSPRRRRSMYHQLVFGLMVSSLSIAVAYMGGTSWHPVDSAQYQANGSEAGCTFQGFLIQWGQTSVFYHALLQLYFWYRLKQQSPSTPTETIMLDPPQAYLREETQDSDDCDGNHHSNDDHVNHDDDNGSDKDMREQFIECPQTTPKVDSWLRVGHILAIVMGLGLAVGGIPFYNTSLTVCTIVPAPINRTNAPLLGFVMIPTALCLIWMLVSHIQLKIQQQRRRRRHDTTTSSNSKPRLYKISSWYTTTFFVVWPGNLFGIFIPINKEIWWLLIMGVGLPASTAFLNGLVYFCYEYARNQSSIPIHEGELLNKQRGRSNGIGLASSDKTFLEVSHSESLEKIDAVAVVDNSERLRNAEGLRTNEMGPVVA